MSDKLQAPSGERLAKVIARAGVCSRRDAESWITQGRVAVNGSPVKTPAFNVVPTDKIVVDGKPIAQREATQAWLYHKPAGLMVTEKDPEGRPTVFEAFERLGLPRVLTVGRLDFNTEGLLILTNDGGLKRTLELPSTGWVRRYRVRAFGKVTQEQLDSLANGTVVDGVEYGPIEATLDSTAGANVWVSMSLREGKNREVRNVLGSLGLEVNRLIRLSYGPFQLGDLPVGAVEKVKDRVLKDQLGKRLAESAGADFDGPVPETGNAPRRRTPERDDRPTERDRYGGLRKRPDFKRREEPQGRERTVHFDDGRPSQTFVEKPDFKRGKRDDDRSGRGERPSDGSGFKKRYDDGPRKPRAEGDKPSRKTSGEGFAKRGDGGPRKPRQDGDRPFRKDGPRTEDKRFGDRPARAGGKKPYGTGPRGTGEQSASAGRPARRDGGKPFGERSERPRDGRAFDGPKPSSRPGGKPGGRSFAGPGGARPGGKPSGGPRGGRPGGDKPAGGPRGGKPGGGRPSGGRPSGGPRGRKGS
ncbi:pseudouridine synthase [Pelagibacterium lentulum]|uniref:Pseudouridine synthase n=1 Tax=Pelagibacterium lentulum TaxID=2029865 RepID=A0A916RGM4_9HYPH|nr:pseudouridine synthase [Pelagibacterium lentulum]GGA56375.1 hypothetical protein GCM10011499_28180 [Pelagibacterium lentulum]